MNGLLIAALTLFAPPPPDPLPLATVRFVQVAPSRAEGEIQRGPEQRRAVLLIHGFRPHPFSQRHVGRAEFSSWQRPDAALVKALATEADVFAYAYAQQWPADVLARELIEPVRRLHRAGYEEITLIGHSAGGLIARLFVEELTAPGVTKVVQVCTPNDGTALARARLAVRASQEPFLRSLTHEARQTARRQHEERRLPETVQFVCVAATLTALKGDGVVSLASQWPEDLQAQRVPVVRLAASHVGIMRSSRGIETLVRVVRENWPRWSVEQVEEARRQLFKR